jgi:hypothetical protein
METAIALVVVGALGYLPARKIAKAALMEAQTASEQTKTSNGMTVGVMVEAIYNDHLPELNRKLDRHIESPNPHKWDPDIVASLD